MLDNGTKKQYRDKPKGQSKELMHDLLSIKQIRTRMVSQGRNDLIADILHSHQD